MMRRRWLGTAALSLLGTMAQAQSQPAPRKPPPLRALREMQIHRVAELGLDIWVENQPAWETQMIPAAGGHPSFVAQSPDSYVPPTVMSYTAWPRQRVAQEELAPLARIAIRRASQNFGLNAGQSRGLFPVAASHGVLEGFEADFAGRAHRQALDVKVFVGQTPGRYPVALSVYTQQGKLDQLAEVLRRGWGQLKYLG